MKFLIIVFIVSYSICFSNDSISQKGISIEKKQLKKIEKIRGDMDISNEKPLLFLQKGDLFLPAGTLNFDNGKIKPGFLDNSYIKSLWEQVQTLSKQNEKLREIISTQKKIIKELERK